VPSSCALERRIDNQIAVGNEQRILALIRLAGPDERLDEAVPDRLPAVDGHVRGDAELLRALFDVFALLGIDAAGVGEHGVHGPAALLEIRHAETGIESTGKREDDVFAHGTTPTEKLGMGERGHDGLLYVQAVLGFVDGDARG
jgi:hypothetical protein